MAEDGEGFRWRTKVRASPRGEEEVEVEKEQGGAGCLSTQQGLFWGRKTATYVAVVEGKEGTISEATCVGDYRCCELRFSYACLGLYYGIF